MRVTQKQIQTAIREQHGIDGVHAVHFKNMPGQGAGGVNFMQLLTHQNGPKTFTLRTGKNQNIYPIAKLSEKTADEWAELFGQMYDVSDAPPVVT